MAGQFLRPNKPNISDLSTFLLTNSKLLFLTLCAYLFIVLVGSLLLRLVHQRFDRFASLKLALYRTPFLTLNQIFAVSSKFGVLVLSFTLFLFFMRNFLGGCIKTEKTVLRTDELIDSRAKLLATEKTMIIHFDQIEVLAKAPDGSFLKRLYQKERFPFTGEADETNWSLLFSQPMDTYFVFSNDVHALFTLAALAPYANSFGMFAFVQPEHSYFENMNAFYLRSSLDMERKKFIHRR